MAAVTADDEATATSDEPVTPDAGWSEATLAGLLDEQLPRLALAAVLRLRDRVAAIAAAMLACFDRARRARSEGATSTTGWLKAEARMAGHLARRQVIDAHKLTRLPAIAQAWRDGTLSSDQVATILGHLSQDTLSMFAAIEADAVTPLAAMAVADLRAVMGLWRAEAENLLHPDQRHEPARRLFLSHTLDGRWYLNGHLDAEGGALVAAALGACTRPDIDGETRIPAERRADALVELARWHLDTRDTPAGSRNRPHLNVMIDLADLTGGGPSVLADGTTLDPVTTARLACDATVAAVLFDGPGRIIHLGRTTRVASAAQHQALEVRDRHCRFPGCDRPATWCADHHVRWWTRDHGETDPDNLILLCHAHHQLLHQPGWHAHLDTDATLTITRPDGTILTSHPPRRLPQPAHGPPP